MEYVSIVLDYIIFEYVYVVFLGEIVELIVVYEVLFWCLDNVKIFNN